MAVRSTKVTNGLWLNPIPPELRLKAGAVLVIAGESWAGLSKGLYSAWPKTKAPSDHKASPNGPL